MEGGTTFYFVTEGVESALRQARAAAKGGTFAWVAVRRRFAST
jgi:hypothetical protein